MFIRFFSSQVTTMLTNASAVKMSSMDATFVKVGCVARRRSADVVAEMAEIAKVERARMVAQAAPTPTPTPSPGQYSQRRPKKLRKLRTPINPAPPPELVRVAAVRAVEDVERERRILEEADRLIRRARTPTPPRRSDDHYDLARWSRQR